MSYNTLSYEVTDRVLVLTLNRPDQLNAFTVEMANELVAAFERASEDDEVGAGDGSGEAGGEGEGDGESVGEADDDVADGLGGLEVGFFVRDGGKLVHGRSLSHWRRRTCEMSHKSGAIGGGANGLKSVGGESFDGGARL